MLHERECSVKLIARTLRLSISIQRLINLLLLAHTSTHNIIVFVKLIAVEIDCRIVLFGNDSGCYKCLLQMPCFFIVFTVTELDDQTSPDLAILNTGIEQPETQQDQPQHVAVAEHPEHPQLTSPKEETAHPTPAVHSPETTSDASIDALLQDSDELAALLRLAARTSSLT